MIHYSPESKRILQINAPDWLIGEEKVKLEIKKENTEFKKFLADNPLIKKIKEGEGVTSKELLEIEKSLQKLNPYISIENIQKIERIDFLVFLHKIIGLTNEYDPKELIKREFDKYMADKNYTSKQLEFLSLLKKVFAERKHIELKDFAKHPLNQERPFEVDELKELVVVCNKIKMK
jgi:type I restriction enzyme R subunit